jgi:hypothetical protein
MSINKYTYHSILLSFALLTGGCQSFLDKAGYVKRDAVQEEINKIQAINKIALEKKEAEIKGSINDVIINKDNQLQSAANSVWAADNAFKFYQSPARLDIIINNRIKEALASLGLGPTLEAVNQENIRLTRELDEKLTSLEDLKKTNEEIIKKNAELVAATKEKEELVKKIEAEKIEMQRAGNERLFDKQQELNTLNNKLIDQEKANAQDKKYIESNKRLIIITLGICSIIGLFVAIYLPVFRKESGYFAAITGGIALGVPFIQPLHINIILLCGLAYVAFLIIKKHNTSHKTNENLVNALQDVKDDKPELYNQLKPILSEWNTKYSKNGKKVEDPTVIKHIEQILKDYERK